MTTLVSLDAVAKRHAERQVLVGVTLGIDDGDRVGVIGLNGSGKSTLLRLIAGADDPDSGRVVLATHARVAFVPQEPSLDPALTVLDAVLARDDGASAAAAEFEAATAALQAPISAVAVQARLERATRAMDAAGGWDLERRARAMLDRLGLSGEVSRRVGEVSGGQRKRAALARGLAADAELLVLDEPTNQLDIDAVEWLEDTLRARRGALVMVTHDRYLLDRLATRIVEVANGGLHGSHGSYADYLQTRARREEQAAAAERQRASRARVELAWLRRVPAARTSRDRLRAERADALRAAGGGPEPAAAEFGLPQRRLGTRVVDLLDVGKRYGDRWVLRAVTHRLAPGARVGVVGPNGAGKTTLLALIAGRLAPDEGRVVVGETVVAGWYGQDPEPLPPAQRVLDAVDEVARETIQPDGRRVGAGGLMERFGFPAALQRSWVAELSGGERRRLELLRVLAGAPNLLLLDEPTNDLDLDTLTVLEEFLDTWRGALVVASHDRYLLDRVCDDIFAIEDGTVRHHPGGWSAWRASRRAPARSPQQQQRARPERQRRLGYSERRELASLERRLADLETRKTDLTAELERGGADYEAIMTAGEELTGVLSALDETETRWLELAEIGE